MILRPQLFERLYMILDAFFSLLNAAILVALGVYAAKRYVVPALKTEMIAHKVYKLNLESEYNSLEYTEQQLHEQIVAQKVLYKDLTQKIEHWNSVFAQTEQQKVSQYKIMQIELARKYEYQEAQRALYRTQKRIMPAAIAQAQRELEQIFDVESAGQEYISHVLDSMRKN